MSSLQSRRRQLAVCICVYKLVNDLIGCPQLSSLLPFRIDAKNTRSSDSVVSNCDFYVSGPLTRRILLRFNISCDNVDPFAISPGGFIDLVLKVTEK